MNAELPLLPPLQTFAVLSAIVIIRYFVVSGLPFLALNVLGAERLRDRRIEPVRRDRSVEWAAVRREISWSIVSSLIFAAAGTALVFAWRAGWTKIYADPSLHGIFWLPLSFAALALAHETYFYWTHRWMHLPRVFRRIHFAHHESREPTAFASFAFHPIEAVIQAAIIPALAMLIPVHWAVFFCFLLFMTALGVINHLGYELYPRNFARHPFFRHWVSATHHQLHHRKTSWNYGLYFNIWDRWMSTEHSGYENGYRAPLEPKALSTPDFDLDVAIVGGGLAGGLLALRLSQLRPELRVRLLEAGDRLGGHHTWSFHGSDVGEGALKWLQPVISRSWRGYDVKFPAFQRRISGSSYHSIASSGFHDGLTRVLGHSVRIGADAEIRDPHTVRTEGVDLNCRSVFDARGWPRTETEEDAASGFQKFVGLDVRLELPHGLSSPLLMDATVPQLDGYRFFYLLPWEEDRLLIEDTRYSSGSSLEASAYEEEIRSYASARGWRIREIIRRESGVLPIPSRPPRVSGANWPEIGARGGLFHDTTGYSLPDAVRVAELLARMPELSSESASTALSQYRASREPQRRFLRLLNRMLFQAAVPEERYKVLQHFHRLPEPLIARFYSGELSWSDSARILSGRPPVPVRRAIQAALQL